MPRRNPHLADMSEWATRNIHPLSNGQLAVRPGLRELLTPTSGYEFIAGHSVRSDVTDEVWHYLVERKTADDTVQIRVVDEDFNNLQLLDWGDSPPSSVSLALAQGQLMLTAPELPTVWGYVGGAIHLATAPSTFLTVYTPLPIPRGISVGWADRFVISDGTALYFSEGPIRNAGSDSPGRTFLGDNALNPPGGSVKGLHVSAAGDLFVVTDSGVWGLNREAASTGQFVLGIFAKVTDYVASQPGCSATVRGRVWGCTAKGVRLIDTPDPHEARLNDPDVPMTTGDPIRLPDYRLNAKVYGGELGAVVAPESLAFACVFDDATETYSWWSLDDVLVGVLKDEFGRDLYLTKSSLTVAVGNYDEDEGTVSGVFLGRLPTSPWQAVTLRRVDLSSDTPDNIVCAVRGTQKTEAPPQADPVIGTDVWDTGTYEGPSPVRSRRFHWAVQSDDLALEVGAERPLSRVDVNLNYLTTDPSDRRPTD